MLQSQADNAASTTKKISSSMHHLPDPSDAMNAADMAAAKDPAPAMPTAWKDVEDSICPAMTPSAGGHSPSVPEVVTSLIRDKGLDPGLEDVAYQLESLRRVAAASSSVFSPATAVSFVAAAKDLSQLIKAAAGNP